MQFLLLLLLALPLQAEEPRLLPAQEIGNILDSFLYDGHGKIRKSDLVDSHYEFKTLKYDPEKGGVIGDCESVLHSAPFVIHIEERYWVKAPYVDRWALVYHELGHCACGLDHSMEAGTEWLVDLLEKSGIKVGHARHFEDGCPDSLMYYKVPNATCVVIHRDEYVNDLFDRCKRPIRFDGDIADFK